MKILVLAGGADQIALIQELKKRGHQIILVDYFENPPAKKFADCHIVASTLDLVSVEQIAKEEGVDLVCTACTDQALLTVACVSEKLGLPCYISYKTGLNVTNKSYMKKVLMANNIPTSKYTILSTDDESQIDGFVFPLVVKPVDCNSSKGVKRIENNEEFHKYTLEAINFSRTKTAIVEEFVEGREISADFYIDHGAAKFLSATTSLKIANRKSFTILCSDYPAVNEQEQKKLTQIATDIAKAFALDNTPLLVQLIANEKGMKVLEFSARMGGGSKYRLIQVLSGVNIMSVYVDRLLGDYPSVNPQKQVEFCRMVYLYCTPGKFDHIEGIEELKSKGIIDEYFLYKTKGMEIHASETSGDRPAGYLCTAKTKKELEDKIKFVDKSIKVLSSDGSDIMIHGLLENIN